MTIGMIVAMPEELESFPAGIGTAEKTENIPGYKVRSYKINHDHKPKAGSTFGFSVIQDLHEADHLFKADGIAAVYGMQSKAGRDHCLPKTGRTGKDQVAQGDKTKNLLIYNP